MLIEPVGKYKVGKNSHTIILDILEAVEGVNEKSIRSYNEENIQAALTLHCFDGSKQRLLDNPDGCIAILMLLGVSFISLSVVRARICPAMFLGCTQTTYGVLRSR